MLFWCLLGGLVIIATAGAVISMILRCRTAGRDDTYARVDQLIAAERYEDAIELIENAPDTREAHVEQGLRLGICQSMLGRFERARETFDAALAVAPEEPRLLYNRALLEFRQRNDDEALSRLNDLARLAPYFPGAHFHIGRIYERRQQPEQALRHYVKELNIDPACGPAQQRFLYLKRKVQRKESR